MAGNRRIVGGGNTDTASVISTLSRKQSIREVLGKIHTMRRLKSRRTTSSTGGDSLTHSSVTGSPRKGGEGAFPEVAMESLDLIKVLEDIPEELLETSGIFLGSI